MSITHIRKPLPVEPITHVVESTDWLDPQAWSRVQPVCLAAIGCLLAGLIMIKLAWARSPWLRSPGRLAWLTGLGLLWYAAIMLVERQIAILMLVVTLGVGVPVVLALLTVYVFRGTPSRERTEMEIGTAAMAMDLEKGHEEGQGEEGAALLNHREDSEGNCGPGEYFEVAKEDK